jgi:hypothetical protein
MRAIPYGQKAVALKVTLIPLGGSFEELADANVLKLSGPEQLRARSIHDTSRRREFVLSHLAIQCLAQRTNGGKPFHHVRSPQGKPLLIPGPHISVSRAGGFASVGMCQAQEIGVDLASIHSKMNGTIARRYPGLASRLRSGGVDGTVGLLRAWTELEATAKLRQTPMQQLLAASFPPPILTSFLGQDLLLTIAVEREQSVALEWANWDVGGDLQITSLRQFKGGEVHESGSVRFERLT